MIKILVRNRGVMIACCVILCLLIAFWGSALLSRSIKNTFFSLIDNILTPKSFDEEHYAAIEMYLEEKYQQEVILDKYLHDYRGAPGALVYFSKKPELKFVSYDNYDYFLVSCLEFEAKQKIEETCNGIINVHDSNCDFSYNDVTLSAFYEKNGRPLSWVDKENKETISSIIIHYTPIEEFDVLKAEQLAESIVKGFGEQHVCFPCEISFVAISSQLPSRMIMNILIQP